MSLLKSSFLSGSIAPIILSRAWELPPPLSTLAGVSSCQGLLESRLFLSDTAKPRPAPSSKRTASSGSAQDLPPPSDEAFIDLTPITRRILKPPAPRTSGELYSGAPFPSVLVPAQNTQDLLSAYDRVFGQRPRRCIISSWQPCGPFLWSITPRCAKRKAE